MLKPCNPNFPLPKPGSPIVHIAAVALVDTDRRVLIAKRPEGKPMEGLWEFPGGKLAAGETPELCLVRELKEELGIETHPSCFLPFTYASHTYDDFHLLLFLSICRNWAGVPRGKEGQQLKWVTARELAEYPMPEANKRLVTQLFDEI